MDGESLAKLESQKKFCQSLVQKVVAHETFILLSGESGSGRTVICEQVVNETDAKMRAVFIPCHKDMQIQRLRELFLQQLLPTSAFDTNLNLADALVKMHIPHSDRILVVVDDADTVVSSFYNELLALYEQFLGQDRFAFVLVGKPLWAEEKITHHQGKSEIVSMQIPPLNIDETMVLARNVFAYHDAMRIYSAIAKSLPDILIKARGNISQIINLSEKVMKQPTAHQVLKDKGGKLGSAALKGNKKKSSSVGIFVTAVCIIIVLACLIPIFFGGNFFSSDSGNDGFDTPTQAQVANDGALVFDGGNRNFNPNTPSDDGVILPNVPNGIDAKTPDKQTEHSVTLSGEDLDKIEGGANNSDYPRRVGGSLANNQVQAQEPQVAPSIPVLRRGDNFNHVNNQTPRANTQIVAQQPPAQKPINQANVEQNALGAQNAQNAQNAQDLAQKAQDKLALDRKQAQEAQKAEEEKQNQRAQAATPRPVPTPQQSEPQRPPLRAGQIINLADEQRQNAQRQQANTNNAPRGNASEGNLSEISAKDNNRYTVQIVSASNRDNIRKAATHLNGRFWIIQTTRNGRPWYILIAGDYASRDEASAAARNIPRAVSQGATPFAKRFGDIKNEMR